MSETAWYVCSWCEARQSKHEKFPNCAYCEGGLLNPEDTPPSADATAGEREVHALRDEISHLRGAIEEACDALVLPADDRLIRIQRVITHLRAELAASRERTYLIRQTAGAAAASSAPTEARDATRLDWLEANHACVGHHKHSDRWYSRAGCRFKTVREAIDAAMSARAARHDG